MHIKNMDKGDTALFTSYFKRYLKIIFLYNSTDESEKQTRQSV